MKETKAVWLLALVFLVLGGATRFYRLDWSYGPDEVASMHEAESLAKEPYFLSDPGITDRLPRANPLPYLAQIASARVFGQSEFGTRLVFALAVSLFFLAGFLMSLKSTWRMLRPFSVLAAAAVLQCVLVPFLAPHRIAYVFPMAIAFVVLAASVFALIHEKLREQSRLLPPTLAAAVLLPTFLHLVSYYQDGNRHDYRAAAEYVREQRLKGDLVTADRNAIFGHYLGEEVTAVKRPETRPRQCVARLEELRQHGQRVWYVCRYDTSEPSPETDQWLWTHAVRMRRFRKRRLDHRENIVDVYLFPAAGSREKDDGASSIDESGAGPPREILVQPVAIRRFHS